MSTNREKTSSVMGFTVSVLLHGIFFAGCLALDAASLSGVSAGQNEPVEIQEVDHLADHAKTKS